MTSNPPLCVECDRREVAFVHGSIEDCAPCKVFESKGKTFRHNTVNGKPIKHHTFTSMPGITYDLT